MKLTTAGRSSMTRPRKVVQYSLIGEKLRTYSSIREAQQDLGITHISSVCRKQRMTDGGYLWRYENEDDGVDYLKIR